MSPSGAEGVLEDPVAGDDSQVWSFQPFEQEDGTRKARIACLLVSKRFGGLVLSLRGAIVAGVSPPLRPEIPGGGASVFLGVPTPQ